MERSDAAGKLRRGALDVRYRYGPGGLRHSKTVRRPFAGGKTTTTLCHWDGQHLVMETSPQGDVKRRYLRGAGLLAQRSAGSLQYYLHNAHGDVVQRMGENGNNAPRYRYDAFGNELEPCATDPNPWRYCGEYRDAESGEYYLRSRSYNPETGRFTSEDVAKSGTNWYAYCDGDPVSKVDPSGMYGTGADAGSSYADWWNKMFGGGKTGGGGSTGSTPTQSTDEGDAARLDIASGGANLDGTRAEPTAPNVADVDSVNSLSAPSIVPSDWQISSVYYTDPDSTRNPEHGSREHVGLDMIPPGGVRGKDVQAYSVWGGVVDQTGSNKERGNYVVIKLNAKKGTQDVYILYQHLDNVMVEEDQLVVPGLALGVVGDEGARGDYHLHAEIWVGGRSFDENGGWDISVTVDPLTFEAEGIANPFVDYGFNPINMPGR